MSDTTPIYDVSDADLEARLTGGIDADPAAEDDEADEQDETPATTPADEEPAAEDEQQDEATEDDAGDADEDTPDDGPGNRKVALQREREARRAIQAERDALAAEVATYRQQQAQAQHAAQQAAEAERQQQIQDHAAALREDGRDEEADAFLHQVYQTDAAAVQRQAQAQVQQARFTMAANLAATTIPDYVPQIQAMYAAIPAAVADAMFADAENPALAAYQYASTHFPTAEKRAAQVKAEAAALIETSKAKLKPAPHQGAPTIAHLGSGTQAPPAPKRPAKSLTDKGFEQRMRAYQNGA